MREPGSTQEPIASGKHEPRVDVVIPVLNEAHVLAKSVATIRGFLNSAVTWQWRIVIVDNGSTDGTDDVGRQLTRQYPDVQFVQLPQRGRGRALRHAWTQSDADIVSYTDVDLSTELEALVDYCARLRAQVQGDAVTAPGTAAPASPAVRVAPQISFRT